ncbi:hypothetical protein ENTCAN_06127 [Enterobacter cancerogenus ATCC 35316]|nr:hypothetical protein ENTCAN_06127 [Enterobacter cancerogenus ATCC 35316]
MFAQAKAKKSMRCEEQRQNSLNVTEYRRGYFLWARQMPT